MSYLSLGGAWFVHGRSGLDTASTPPPSHNWPQSVLEPPDD